LSMDEPSTTRSAAVMSRSICSKIRESQTTPPGPAKADGSHVHYLFYVRNMFFSVGGVLVPFDRRWSLFS
jgi:hypothetical protein